MLSFIRTPLLREFYHNTASRKKPRQYYPVPLPRPCVHYFLGFSKLEQIVPVIFPPAVVLIWKKLAKRINSKYLALWQKIIVDSLPMHMHNLSSLNTASACLKTTYHIL